MNKTFRKSLISVAAASFLVVGFTGCETGNEIKNDNSAEYVSVSSPKGTVVGLVQDTNGNPVEGATVTLADGQTTTTDAGGTYQFEDVTVTNTAGTDANTGHNNITVTVTAANHLGAVVTVNPQAQIDDAETNAGGDSIANVETFIDGFTAQAGTAVLPELTATVTGKLEMAGTEAIVANAEITLDFLNVNNGIGGNVAQAQNGVATTYATNGLTFIDITNAEGKFTISGVPADTNLTYVVANYTVKGEEEKQGDAFTVTTNAETSVVNVGDIQVTPIVNEDNTSPYVTKVDGVIDKAALRGMLNDDVRGATNPFVITFSEPLGTHFDTNSVTVYDKTNKAYPHLAKTPTLSADGTQLTVTLPSDLNENVKFDINILVADARDIAGNYLRDNNTTIKYDTITGTNNQVLQLQLQTFDELNLNAPAVTASQMTIDNTGSDDQGVADLQAGSDSFNDVDDENTTGIQMLNSDEKSAERLSALATELVGTTTVDNHVARITFTPSGATGYIISKKNKVGKDIDVNTTTLKLDDLASTNVTETNVADANRTVVIKPNDIASIDPIEFVLTDAKIGDEVKITPLDDLNNSGTATVVTLADNVAPTTVLQYSYGEGNSANTVTASPTYGQGGELSQLGADATLGVPYLTITAGLLDNLDSNGKAIDPKNSNSTHDDSLAHELYTYNTKKSDGTYYIAGTAANKTYDSNAWAAFITKLERTIGVAFSEDINLAGTPTYTGTTNISDWKPNNNVKIDDNGTTVDVDLIDFNTMDVIALANSDHGAVIDFSAAIKDLSENAGDKNAKVMIEDKMPPFVTKASYNVDGTITVEFNENIATNLHSTPTNLTISLDTNESNRTTITLDQETDYSVSGATLTINNSAFTATEVRTLTKNGAEYNESVYGTENHPHARLDFSNVKDARENSWADANASVSIPRFAMVDLIGDFKILTTNNDQFDIADDTNETAQIVSWTYTHPLEVNTSKIGDLNATAANVIVNNDGSLRWPGTDFSNEINTTFAFFNAGSTESDLNLTSGLDVTLSADRKTLQLTFKTQIDVDADNANDEVRFRANKKVTSALDSTETLTGTAAGSVNPE